MLNFCLHNFTYKNQTIEKSNLTNEKIEKAIHVHWKVLQNYDCEFNGFSNDVLNAVISLVLNKGNCVVN